MVKIPSKNIGTLFCILAILGSLGLGNSFVQAQQLLLQTQQAPTIVYKSPWSNMLPAVDSSRNTIQQLCPAGICSNSTTLHNNPNTQHNGIGASQTFTNSKNFNLNHLFVSNKVIGPDRFRFITSYWTTSDTSRLIDAGTSANESRFGPLNTILAGSWPSLNANPKVEVDTGEGFFYLLFSV